MPKLEYIDEQELREVIKRDAVKVFKDFERILHSGIASNRQFVQKIARKLINKLKTKTATESDFEEFFKQLLKTKNVKVKIATGFGSFVANAMINLSPIVFKGEQGYEKQVVITITKKLLDILEPEEVIAILLHEAGHYFYVDRKFVDKYKTQIILLVVSFVVYLLLGLKGEEILSSRNKIIKKGGIIIIIMFVLTLVYISYLNTVRMKASKKMEQIADTYVAYMGFGPQLKSAFEKLYKSPKYLKNYLSEKNIFLKYTKKIIMILSKIFESDATYENPFERICRAITITLKDESLPSHLKNVLESEKEAYCSRI